MSDPFCYPGTNVLRNKEAIRDAADLDRFERLATRQRVEEGLPNVPLKVDGHRALHRHIFQDVHAWAGEFRTVDISKGNSFFCKAEFIQREMGKRFEAVQRDGRPQFDERQFTDRIAEHISELNAIHPFREGNGRTVRAFLGVAGRQAGHVVHIERVDATLWLRASRESFASGDVRLMRDVIADMMGPAPEREPEHAAA